MSDPNWRARGRERGTTSAKRRRGVATVFPAAVGLLLVLGFFIWRAIHRESIPTPTMPSPNARDYFIQAAEEERAAGSIPWYFFFRQTALGPSPRPTFTERKAVLQSRAPALKTLRQGFSYRFLNPPARSFNALFPEFPRYRQLARVLSLEADFRAGQGDFGGAVSSGLDAMQMGNEMPRGGIVIAKLVGVSCEAIGRHSVWKQVERLTPQDARAAVRRMEQMSATRLPFAATVQQEKWCWMAGMAESLRDARLLDMVRNVGAGQPRTWEITRQQIMLLLGGKGSIVREGGAYLDDLSEYVHHPYAEERPLPKPPSGVYGRAAAGIADALLKSRFTDEQARMGNALLIVALALRAYRVERGSYPSSLDALVAGGYLSRVPNDPFALSGPVNYRRISTEKYVLYSVGPDGVDNGGRPIYRSEGIHQTTPLFSTREDSLGDFVVFMNTPTSERRSDAMNP